MSNGSLILYLNKKSKVAWLFGTYMREERQKTGKQNKRQKVKQTNQKPNQQ